MNNNSIISSCEGEQPLREKMNGKINGNGTKEKKAVLDRNKKRLIFYILWIAIPVIQYSIFGVYANLNSFVLAFQGYEFDVNKGYIINFGLWQNVAEAWNFLISSRSLEMIKNSVILFGVNLIIVMGLSLIFSYYVAKGYFLSNLFRIFLYIPHVVSSVVMVLLYRYICTDVATEVLRSLFGEEWLVEKNLVNGLISTGNPQASYWCVLFYTVWIGFGTKTMLFTGSMSAVDPSIVEAAQLDGANTVREFIHVYIPAVWHTFVTFVVVSLAELFTNQMFLVVFFDSGNPPFQTFGYFFFASTKYSDVIAGSGYMSYSVLAAMGLMITLVLVPTILTVRKLMEKYGPRTD